MRNVFLSIPKTVTPWLPAIVVVVCSIFYACCFTAIYRSPHTYEAASRWIYENIPAGARLAEPHWDDRLPVDLPGKWSGQYKYLELPLYEPDTPQKLGQVLSRIAESDYIILPTQRLQGSIPRVPDEFKNTTRLFQLLFSGQLGFRLEKTVKQRPLFSNWFFDDDLADESFSVYDHPKASIFKNVERLPVNQLQKRIFDPVGSGVLPDLSRLLKADSAVAPAARQGGVTLPAWLQILSWLLVLELLTIAFFPFFAAALPRTVDGGYSAARAGGMLFTGLTAWLLASFKLLTPNALNLWLLLAAFLLISHLVCYRLFGSWKALFSTFAGGIRWSLLLWYGVFTLFVLLRSFQPEIFWGEKPMDYSFLNYFSRSEDLPPQDPWAAGFSMQYYYLGSFIMALLHKLSFAGTPIGYNLAIATIAALIAVVTFALFSVLKAGRPGAALGALALLLLSNLQVAHLIGFGRHEPNFDLFWAGTRLFTSPAFAEYPLWALLFGDLHAHIITVPFVLLILALTAALIEPRPMSLRCLLNPFLTGWAFGALVGLNTWDCITLGVWAAVVLIALAFPAKTSVIEGRGFFSSLLIEALAFLAGFALVAPAFFLSSAKNARGSTGWVQHFELNTASQVLWHFGVWFAIIVLAAALLVIRERQSLRAAWRRSHINKVLALLLAFAPLGFSLYGWWRAGVPAPAGILVIATLLVIAGVILLMLDNEKQALRFSGTFAVAGGLLLIFSELVFINDRMNTIFKLYNTLWLMFAVAALLCLRELVGMSRSSKMTDAPLSIRSRLFLWSARAALTLSGLLVLVAAAGSGVNIHIMTTFQRIGGPRPTLNGEAYLKSLPVSRDESAGYQWIRAHIPGTPVMVEAQGDSYQDFSRVVMHTGVPVVLGWEYHVLQRGLAYQELLQRRYDVRAIYETNDVDRALMLLRKYNVGLIIVGDRERRSYKPEGLRKFADNPGAFVRLFKAGSFAIYAPFYSELARLAPQQSPG